MLTEKDYCDLESTKALESLGMNIYTSFCETEVVKNVLLYEAQKFLREEWGVHIIVHYIYHLNEHVFGTTLRLTGKALRDGGALYDTAGYSTYEEALLEGIKKAIKILKDERIN